MIENASAVGSLMAAAAMHSLDPSELPKGGPPISLPVKMNPKYDRTTIPAPESIRKLLDDTAIERSKPPRPVRRSKSFEFSLPGLPDVFSNVSIKRGKAKKSSKPNKKPTVVDSEPLWPSTGQPSPPDKKGEAITDKEPFGSTFDVLVPEQEMPQYPQPTEPENGMFLDPNNPPNNKNNKNVDDKKGNVSQKVDDESQSQSPKSQKPVNPKMPQYPDHVSGKNDNFPNPNNNNPKQPKTKEDKPNTKPGEPKRDTDYQCKSDDPKNEERDLPYYSKPITYPPKGSPLYNQLLQTYCDIQAAVKGTNLETGYEVIEKANSDDPAPGLIGSDDIHSFWLESGSWNSEYFKNNKHLERWLDWAERYDRTPEQLSVIRFILSFAHDTKTYSQALYILLPTSYSYSMDEWMKRNDIDVTKAEKIQEIGRDASNTNLAEFLGISTEETPSMESKVLRECVSRVLFQAKQLARDCYGAGGLGCGLEDHPRYMLYRGGCAVEVYARQIEREEIKNSKIGGVTTEIFNGIQFLFETITQTAQAPIVIYYQNFFVNEYGSPAGSDKDEEDKDEDDKHEITVSIDDTDKSNVTIHTEVDANRRVYMPTDKSTWFTIQYRCNSDWKYDTIKISNSEGTMVKQARVKSHIKYPKFSSSKPFRMYCSKSEVNTIFKSLYDNTDIKDFHDLIDAFCMRTFGYKLAQETLSQITRSDNIFRIIEADSILKWNVSKYKELYLCSEYESKCIDKYMVYDMDLFNIHESVLRNDLNILLIDLFDIPNYLLKKHKKADKLYFIDPLNFVTENNIQNLHQDLPISYNLKSSMSIKDFMSGFESGSLDREDAINKLERIKDITLEENTEINKEFQAWLDEIQKAYAFKSDSDNDSKIFEAYKQNKDNPKKLLEKLISIKNNEENSDDVLDNLLKEIDTDDRNDDITSEPPDADDNVDKPISDTQALINIASVDFNEKMKRRLASLLKERESVLENQKRANELAENHLQQVRNHNNKLNALLQKVNSVSDNNKITNSLIKESKDNNNDKQSGGGLSDYKSKIKGIIDSYIDRLLVLPDIETIDAITMNLFKLGENVFSDKNFDWIGIRCPKQDALKSGYYCFKERKRGLKDRAKILVRKYLGKPSQRVKQDDGSAVGGLRRWAVMTKPWVLALILAAVRLACIVLSGTVGAIKRGDVKAVSSVVALDFLVTVAGVTGASEMGCEETIKLAVVSFAGWLGWSVAAGIATRRNAKTKIIPS